MMYYCIKFTFTFIILENGSTL